MSSTASHPAQRHNRVLACVLCQHRKIKCDRNMPCANCVKANVKCTPSTPAPARKRRRPNQDLQERLARCEELLKQYVGGSTPPAKASHEASPSAASPVMADPSPDTPDFTPPAGAAQDVGWQPTGKIIKEDGGVRLLDSYVLASVYEELRGMRSIIETGDPEECSVLGSEDNSPDNYADILFPAESPSPNVEELQPEPGTVFRLWQLFLDRVNPLSKVIHVPSLQPYVMEGATNICNLSLSYQALLFAIYTMAVVSMSETECLQILSMSREQALRRFGTGAKLCFVRFNILKNHDMAVLQALVLYLYSLQGRFDRHAVWVFSGIVVRIAQKMGYHRDGELLGLPPFESEMRRRIWWQVLMQDAKNAMASGLSRSLVPINCDCKMPLNINDADLFPTATEPVKPREGPTEMAFVLMTCQVCSFVTKTQVTSGVPAFDAAVLVRDGPSDGTSNPALERSLEQYRSMVSDLDADMMAVESNYVDMSAGNVHIAALALRPMLIKKLRQMLIPMHEQPEWGTEIFEAKDNLFKTFVLNTEHNSDTYETMERCGFLWFAKMLLHLDVLLVMMGQLMRRPAGTLADRAWNAIDKIYAYHPELTDMSQKQNAQMAYFALKAWKAREMALVEAGRVAQPPLFVLRLQENTPNYDSRSSTRSQFTPPSLQLQQRQQQSLPLPPPPLAQQQQQQEEEAKQKSRSAPELDQFLGGYLPVSALNWDMWGDMTANGAGLGQVPPSAFNEFDVAELGGPL